MQTNSVCLTADALRRLATNEFSPEQLLQLESHLDQCPHCLELVQREVAAPWMENSVIEVMRSANPSCPTWDDNPAIPSSYDSILKMLGPTDDPHRLGRIDAYEVVGIIGRGGMGVVFKAFDPSLQRFVAIKMLLPHLAESAAARKRFAREAKAAAAVVDDFVLPIHGVAEWRGVPYIVSQYCRGETLQTRIENQGTLETKEVLRIAAQIAKGLAAAHAQGLVHRDVKPANILLDKGIERVQLTDFGLARAMDDASMTRTGVLAGTPQFMSPEQAQGEPLDGRSDLFALGSVMYTMCTGRPPFRGPQPLTILKKISHEKHKPVELLNADVPRRLARLIDRLLEKRPIDRIPSAMELAQWLENYLAYLQHPLGQSKPRLPLSNKVVKRWISIGIASSLMGAIAIGTWFALPRSAERIDPESVIVELNSNETESARETARGPVDVETISANLRIGLQALVNQEQQMLQTDVALKQLNQALQAIENQSNAVWLLPSGEDVLQQEIQLLQFELENFERQHAQW